MNPIAHIALLRLAFAEFAECANPPQGHKWMRLRPVLDSVEWFWEMTKVGSEWLPMVDGLGISHDQLAQAYTDDEAVLRSPARSVGFGYTASGEAVWTIGAPEDDPLGLRPAARAWHRCFDELLAELSFASAARWDFRPSDGVTFDLQEVKDRGEAFRQAQAVQLQRFPDGVVHLLLPESEQLHVTPMDSQDVDAMWALS